MLKIENNTSSSQQTLKLNGALCGIDALQFRDKTTRLIEIEEGQLVLDVSEVSKMDLTGFNAMVMLKKEAFRGGLGLLLIAEQNNPIHEYIHLSKLSFNCVKPSSI